MLIKGQPNFAYTSIASSGSNSKKECVQAAAPCGTKNNEPTPGAMPLRDVPQACPTSAEAATPSSLIPTGIGSFTQHVPQPLLFDIERRDFTLSDLGLVPLKPQSHLQSLDLVCGGGNVGEGTKLALPSNSGGIFDLSWGAAPLPRPLSSMGSTATRSPPESTASGTLSVPIDFASVTDTSPPVHHREGSWSSSSRDPSPPSKSGFLPPQERGEDEKAVTEKEGDIGGGYVCLASWCEAKFGTAEDLDLHARTAHQHICLWGRDGPCDSPGFATRAELNWHVKREHLLICPVLGCKDSAFPSPEVVDCHLKYVHGGSKEDSKQKDAIFSSGFLPASAEPAQSVTAATSASAIELKERGRKMGSPDDRLLKMDLSIGTSKKRCREQMRAVLVKRAKRANGAGNLPAVDSSSSQISRMMEASNFPVIWEHGVLPFLVKFMPKWCSPGGLPSHVISVVRGKKPGTRRICIMTTRPLSRARRIMIAWHVRDLLPSPLQNATSFVFSTGEVDRLWARGLGKRMPDEVCEPRNPFCYLSPRMGDSIGVTLFQGDEITATLGPCLTVGDGSYWLANFHPFVEAIQEGASRIVQHPSPDDRSRCLEENHDALNSVAGGFNLGSLTAMSGYDLKTTRVTHDPYWEDCDREPPLIVTDWTLISANTSQANVLRRFPSSLNPRRESPVTSTSPVVPGAVVCSTGRTSGHQRGQICEVPAYVYGTKAGNGTGRATREWFIEELDPDGDDDAWIRGGIGVQGDSGAAVVDCGTNALMGQVWGRNKYYGPGPRQTFFTPILDVIDDVQEKCGEQTRPQLPQYRECRDEADRWPVYPVCRRCFDAREYLDSRRSSRSSLMSMIGFAGDGSGSGSGREDHDLTSISELATPKEYSRTPRDTSHLVRHVGSMDEPTASSFMLSAFSPASLHSAVSPMPVHTFVTPCPIKSPETDFAHSPYAQALDEADLCDPKPLSRTESLLGKRPHLGAASLAMWDSFDQDKRRRI